MVTNFTFMIWLVVQTPVTSADPPVEELLKQLEDPSPRVRWLAADKLGRRKVGSAATAIANLMTDPDQTVRSAARKALVRIGSDSAVPLAKSLASPKESVRLAVAGALVELGAAGKDAVPALTTALKDPTVDVRIHAAVALGQIGPHAKDALPALREAASDTANMGSILRMRLPTGVAEAAINASLKIDSTSGPSVAKDALPTLVKVVTSGKPADIQAAAAAIAALGNHAKTALPDLEKAVPKEDGFAKMGVESAIDKLGGDREDEQIATDRNQKLEKRLRAIEKLRFRPPTDKLTAALGTLLTDPEPKVRLGALKAVETGRSKSKEITAGLVGLLDDEAVHAADERKLSQDEIRTALKRLGKFAAPDLAAILADPKRKLPIRYQVGEVLLQMGTRARGVLPQLEACTKDRYLAIVVISAAASVRAGGDFGEVREILKAGLRHKVPSVVYMTASAVETLGPLAEPLIPDLTALLEHEEREVRITAARGLCRMRSAAARAVPAIVALLKSDDDRQRYQVANALSELGSQAKAAAPELAERVKDVENVYPDPTLKLLAAIGPDAKVAIPALMEVAKNTKHRRQLDALETLARIGPDAKAAVPLLVNQLSAQSSYDRTRAAKALGVFGPIAKDAVPKLRELLEDPEDAVRVWASFALARITGDYEPNIETILSYWLDPADRWVPLGATADANSEIADALAMLGTDAKPAQKWVVRKLGDPKISAGAQSHLCRVVSNLKDEAAIPMLVELLEHADPEGWSTGSILDALATFGSEAKGAKKQVEALLDHDRQEVADAAARALRRIDTPVR